MMLTLVVAGLVIGCSAPSKRIDFADRSDTITKEVENNVSKLIETDFCPVCDLSGANLDGADLTGAVLEGANLYDANLNGANLTGANLAGAILNGVRGANFSLALNCPPGIRC